MKPSSLLALLVAFLCVGTVSSLAGCFTCDGAESNIDCLVPKACQPNEEYCLTKYFGGGTGDNHKQSISKSCSTMCPEAGIDIGIMAFSVKCCKTAFCNVSGAVSVKSSSLMLAVGALASLFYIFQTKL